jgi:hypothetical protein
LHGRFKPLHAGHKVMLLDEAEGRVHDHAGCGEPGAQWRARVIRVCRRCLWESDRSNSGSWDGHTN